MRPVNLIPESERRRKPEGEGNSSYAVLAVLGAVLLMTLTYVFVANQATSRSNDAAEASAEADRLEARAAELGSFGDFAAIKQTRIASVQQIAASRFDWERLIRELARVLPDGSWLHAVDASTTGDGVDTAAAATDGTAAVGPQAHLTGCTPRQPDTAQLLLRLGRMHRVEDVVLGNSTREQGGARPTLDSCGRLYQFDVTVSFAPTVVEEAPAGEPSVPASLGGGS